MLKRAFDWVVVLGLLVIVVAWVSSLFQPQTPPQPTVEKDTSLAWIPDPIWLQAHPDSVPTVEPEPDTVWMRDTLYLTPLDTATIDSMSSDSVFTNFQYHRTYDFDSVGFSLRANVRTRQDGMAVTSPDTPTLHLKPYNVWFQQQFHTITPPSPPPAIRFSIGAMVGRENRLLFGVGTDQANFFLAVHPDAMEVGAFVNFNLGFKGFDLWTRSLHRK